MLTAKQETLTPMYHAGYADNEHSRHWLQQRQWARGVLNKPNVVYPNGRDSHECALYVLEQAEDELLEDSLYAVSSFADAPDSADFDTLPAQPDSVDSMVGV